MKILLSWLKEYIDIDEKFFPEFLEILKIYFNEHPSEIGIFPIEKLFPNYNPTIIKMKEWS